MTFTIKTPEGVAAADKFLEAHAYLSGGNAPGAPDRELLAEIEAAKFIPDFVTAPNLYGWWWTLALFREPARALWGAAEAKKAGGKKETAAPAETPAHAPTQAPKEAEEELDLFGDDPDAEAAAQQQAEKRKKEAEAAKKPKKEKAPIIAKSEVIFDVKGYETSDDFDAIAAKVRKIEKEGLVWKDQHKIVPIGFGMNKLEMGMIIVDDLIGTDDIFEIIEAWEEIQSVDVVKFNKA